MGVTFRAVSSAAVGTTSCATPFPTNAERDLILAFHANKPSSLFTYDELYWQQLVSDAGSSGSGADAGTGRITASHLPPYAPSGGYSGTAGFNFSGGTGASVIGRMVSYHASSNAKRVAVITSTSGQDNTAGTAISVTGSSIAMETGDTIVVGLAVNTDANTFSSHALSASGFTFSLVAERADSGTSQGQDCALVIVEFVVTSGSGSAAPTYTATASGSAGTQNAGAAAFVVLREIDATPSWIFGGDLKGHFLNNWASDTWTSEVGGLTLAPETSPQAPDPITMPDGASTALDFDASVPDALVGSHCNANNTHRVTFGAFRWDGDGAGGGSTIGVIVCSAGSNLGYVATDPDNELGLGAGRLVWGNIGTPAYSDASVCDGEWHTFVVVEDTDLETATLYVGGVAQAAEGEANPASPWDIYLFVAAFGIAAAGFYNGPIASLGFASAADAFLPWQITALNDYQQSLLVEPAIDLFLSAPAAESRSRAASVAVSTSTTLPTVRWESWSRAAAVTAVGALSLPRPSREERARPVATAHAVAAQFPRSRPHDAVSAASIVTSIALAAPRARTEEQSRPASTAHVIASALPISPRAEQHRSAASTVAHAVALRAPSPAELPRAVAAASSVVAQAPIASPSSTARPFTSSLAAALSLHAPTTETRPRAAVAAAIAALLPPVAPRAEGLPAKASTVDLPVVLPLAAPEERSAPVFIELDANIVLLSLATAPAEERGRAAVFVASIAIAADPPRAAHNAFAHMLAVGPVAATMPASRAEERHGFVTVDIAEFSPVDVDLRAPSFAVVLTPANVATVVSTSSTAFSLTAESTAILHEDDS